jgi:hypothetical protein
MTTQHSGPTSFAGRPTVLIFDVNETLIDFESISPLFERVFGDKRVMREWLGHLIMYSMTITLSGLYKNYWSLGGGLFQMVGAIHKVKVTPSDVEALQKAMKTMPAHKDAEEGLKLLKDAGVRMVTLTNSTPYPRFTEPAGARGSAQVLRASIHHRDRPCVQARPGGLSHGGAGTRRRSGGLLHGRYPCLGHHWWTKRRDGRRTHHSAGQRLTARRRSSPTPCGGCGSPGAREGDDPVVAVLRRARVTP